MTSRSAGAPGARTPPFSSLVTERRPLTRTAFRSVFRSTSTQNPVPACSRSARRISRSASSSSSSVAPSRPRATRQPRFTISARGAIPERRCKFEEVLTEIVTLALGQKLKLVRPRPGAMRQGQPLAEKADRVEIFDDAVRKIPIRPCALIARLEQMHVDAAPAARGGLRDAFQQFARAPLDGGRPVLHVESLALTARRDGLDKRKLFADRKRRPDEAPLEFRHAPPRAVRRGSAPTGHRPADFDRAAPAQIRRARPRPRAARATSFASVT